MSFQMFTSVIPFLVSKTHRVQSSRATNGSEAISLPAIGRLFRHFVPRKNGLFLIIAVIIIISLTPPVLHACPGCSAALDNEVGHGFNLSVLYMMAMPFIVFGGVAMGIVYVTRQNRPKAKVNQISTVKKEAEN